MTDGARSEQNLPSGQQTLSQFNITASAPPVDQLDSIATSSSGFRIPPMPLALPIEAWSLGCALRKSDTDIVPVAWLICEHDKRRRTHVLKICGRPDATRGSHEFLLDRAFHHIQYSDPATKWKPDSVATIQLKTTKGSKELRREPGFEPGRHSWFLRVPMFSSSSTSALGSAVATGKVSFKFAVTHRNWMDSGGEAYKKIIEILKEQIKKDGSNHEVLTCVHCL